MKLFKQLLHLGGEEDDVLTSANVSKESRKKYNNVLIHLTLISRYIRILFLNACDFTTEESFEHFSTSLLKTVNMGHERRIDYTYLT